MTNAMDFAEYVERKEGLAPQGYRDVEFNEDGSGIVLRIADVRTYGGQIRLYMDSEGLPVDTGSTTIPMRVRRPFRLSPFSAYVIYFHLSLKELPSGVSASIIPSKRMADIGLMMTNVRVLKGDLLVTVLPLRAIEAIEGYPLAELVFDSLLTPLEYIPIEPLLSSSNSLTIKSQSRTVAHAKNTSNRRK